MFSLSESTEPFNEPLYEKVLRSVRNIKRSLSVIKKAYQEKPAHVGGRLRVRKGLVPVVAKFSHAHRRLRWEVATQPDLNLRAGGEHVPIFLRA